MTDIHQLDNLKNVGIDKDLISKEGKVEEPAPVPKEDVQEKIDQPQVDVEKLKAELSQQSMRQLTSLAEQMTRYAQGMECRVKKLEDQMQNLLKRENERELKPQAQAEAEPAE